MSMTTCRPRGTVEKLAREEDSRGEREPSFRFRGAHWFNLGDAAFLMAVGAESGFVMQWLHQSSWNFFLISILGMAVAMGIQMLMALGLSPLLGSIETMAPSMVVAMVVPMMIDVAELSGWMVGRSEAALLGAASGLLYFSYLEWYGAAFRRRLARTWSARKAKQ